MFFSGRREAALETLLEMERLFSPHTADAPARTVIFMSGSGTNAEALLEFCRAESCALEPVVLATDAPETSRTRELGKRFGVPVEFRNGLRVRTFGKSDAIRNVVERRGRVFQAVKIDAGLGITQGEGDRSCRSLATRSSDVFWNILY